MSRFKIGDKTYDMASLEDLSLRQILAFERETEALGTRMSWGALQHEARVMRSLETDAEREDHPATPWVLAVTVWASRTLAGENVSLAEASDFRLSDLSYLPDPQDHKGKAAGEAKARPASGRAVAKRPARLKQP